MRQRRTVLLLALATAVLTAGALALGGRVQADASALSRGPLGWLAFRRCLDAAGLETALLDRPLSEAPTSDVLVLAFPWQRLDLGGAEAVRRRLAAGGTVLLAYSRAGGVMQELVFEGLGLSWRTVRGRPPLAPRRWRAHAREEWTLQAAPGGPWAPARVRALPQVPSAPAEAEVWLRTPAGVPAAFSYRHLDGTVAVLPAELLANGRLRENAAAVAAVARLGRTWTFDEYHHGLSAPATPAARSSARVLDWWLIHLAVAYVAAVAAMARRFGPAWQAPPVLAGSAATFLEGLGTLHGRLGHHREAAFLLIERARELDPGLALPDELARQAGTLDGNDITGFAAQVARAQAEHRRSG